MTLDTRTLDTIYLLPHHKKCLKQNKNSGSVRDYTLKYLANEKQKTNKQTKKNRKKNLDRLWQG